MTNKEKSKEAVQRVMKCGVSHGTKALATIIMHSYDPANYALRITDLELLDNEAQELGFAVLHYCVQEGSITDCMTIDEAALIREKYFWKEQAEA